MGDIVYAINFLLKTRSFISGLMSLRSTEFAATFYSVVNIQAQKILKETIPNKKRNKHQSNRQIVDMIYTVHLLLYPQAQRELVDCADLSRRRLHYRIVSSIGSRQRIHLLGAARAHARPRRRNLQRHPRETLLC